MGMETSGSAAGDVVKTMRLGEAVHTNSVYERKGSTPYSKQKIIFKKPKNK